MATKHGRFLINPVSVFGSTLLNGEYEPHITHILERYLYPGAVFLDLGANEGYFSVIASRIVGPSGIVIAVEPQSRLQHVIQSNLAENECFNVKVVKCVVSDKSGEARICLAPAAVAGSSSLFRRTRYSTGGEYVRSYSLSDLFDKLDLHHCDLAKVDIEGSEFDVFMSAGDILREGIIKNLSIDVHRSVIESRGLLPDSLHEYMLTVGYTGRKESGCLVYHSPA